ncbi:ABC transporter permease [Rhizobium sp. RU36D]|uniref:ABC transporter permease n=1 Tax=Rhizobium sp. RU36D TaxID=1907415 RepID=UPI0009D7FFBA|nr:ABC transporter permease [Rhizobium sp. RU36D]SMC99760.1 putative hydroxymethylpyrimidine transport system permease protein [Rhizobium sp. RU36D]
MRLLHTGLSLALLLGLWQAVVSGFQPPRYILPSPAGVLQALARQPAFLAEHALITSAEILLGFAAGSFVGAGVAFAVAALPRVGRLAWPMVLVLQAFPVFVLAPVLVLWLGFGMASKVAMTTLIIFFPVASAFADGLNRTPRELLDAAALTKASHWQMLIHIRLPLGLPGLATGLRVAAPLAPLGAVIGEWVGASGGLGFVMVQANARMQTDTVFAAMAVLAALTVVMRSAVDRATRHLTPWAMETQGHPASPHPLWRSTT